MTVDDGPEWPALVQRVREHLGAHFAAAGITTAPDTASVTFLGIEPITVLRFGPDARTVSHYASLGCSRHGMGEDPAQGARAEVVVSLLGPVRAGLARSVAVLAAAPVVEGLVLTPDSIVDLGQPLWEGAPFTAFLLCASAIDALVSSRHATVQFWQASPITATEAAWVRLKGADAMREAWQQDGVDVLDPRRTAGRPR